MPAFNYSLFLTDNIGHPSNSNTNLLCKESILRGYKTFSFTADEISLDRNSVFAIATEVKLDDKGNLTPTSEKEKINLADNHVINLRLDPPFDSRYYTAMNLLEYASTGSLLLNNPRAINNWPEKFIPNELIKFTPTTLITSDIEDIKDFWEEHEDIIIKPLYEFAGRSVFRLQKGDENFKSIFQVMSEKYSEPLIAQIYLPEVKQGDKRIVLLDGEFFGAFNRIAPEGQLQAAMARGGSITPHELTENEKEICEILKPLLKRDGIFLCGLDVIGDYITEINVTCPAAFVGLNQLYKNNTEKIFWDKIEEKSERKKIVIEDI